MTHRAYVDSAWSAQVKDGESRALPEAVAHRFARVLRLEEGAAVELFDGSGLVITARFAPPGAVSDPVRREEQDLLPPLVIAQGMTKADKLDQVVQRACELGGSSILLFNAERSQVHLDDDRADKRRARLVRVAEDAARQSGRARVPTIEGPLPFDQLLALVHAFAGCKAAGVLDAESTLSEALRAAGPLVAQGVLIVVGPEGGLSPKEVARLAEAGVGGVRLGRHVLRTETAGLVALAAVQAHLGAL